MKAYTLAEGVELVKAARHTIDLWTKSPNFRNSVIEGTLEREKFSQSYGVFVTLNNYQTGSLRGCIGFIEGIKPMKNLLVEAALAAASEDPRFVPVSARELDDIIVEVSILSRPERLRGTADEIKKKIRIGIDGLIIEYGYHKGILLPIVAVEEKFGPIEFLENVCLKAGLPKDMWRREGVSLYHFSTQIFREKTPGGDVEEVRLEQL